MKPVKTCCVFEEKPHIQKILYSFFTYFPDVKKIQLDVLMDVSKSIEESTEEEFFFILDTWNDNICEWLIHIPEQCSSVYLFINKCPTIDNIKTLCSIQRELGIHIGIDTYYSFFSLLDIHRQSLPQHIEYCFLHYMSDKIQEGIETEIEKNITLLSYYLYTEKPIQVIQYSSPLVKNNIKKFSHGGILHTQWNYSSLEENIYLSFFDKSQEATYSLKTNTFILSFIKKDLKIENVSKFIFPFIKHTLYIEDFFNKLQDFKIQNKSYLNIEKYHFL